MILTLHENLTDTTTCIIVFIIFFHHIYVLTKVNNFALVQKLQKKYEMNKELFITINAMLDDELENKSTDLAKIGGLWLAR